jgi:peroxiredoxin
LARLRDEYQLFTRRDSEIVAIGPDKAEAFGLYWTAERLPFVGLPDTDHAVASRYKQEVNIFKLGRMPLVTVVDQQGLIRYAHYGASMSDIPQSKLLLEVIDMLDAPSNGQFIAGS